MGGIGGIGRGERAVRGMYWPKTEGKGENQGRGQNNLEPPGKKIGKERRGGGTNRGRNESADENGEKKKKHTGAKRTETKGPARNNNQTVWGAFSGKGGERKKVVQRRNG